MIQLREGELLNGAILAAKLHRPILQVTARDRWTVTAQIEWIERGAFAGEERYMMRLPLASGHLCGLVAVSGNALVGREALWEMQNRGAPSSTTT